MDAVSGAQTEIFIAICISIAQIDREGRWSSFHLLVKEEEGDMEEVEEEGREEGAYNRDGFFIWVYGEILE